MPSNKPEVVGPGGFGPIRLPKFNFRLPGRWPAVLISIVVVVVLVAVVFNMCFTYIRPNEVGIKQVNIGVFTSRGIKETVYDPGLVFRMPFGFEHVHRFPQHLQVLDLTENPDADPTPAYADVRAANIQTSDGFYVNVDVSILYRITDPYKVITSLGPGTQYLHQGVLPKAEPVLKQALGELTTEDFYNSPLRVEKTDKARDLLHAELEPKGISVEHVLVRYFRYSDEIQRNIEEKKLQDQMVFKNQAEARAATEAAQVKKIIEEGEAQVRITLQEGEAYKVRKDAEKDLYVRRKTAEADLIVELAEAKKTELRNTAMQSLGAERAVAMKMAEVLKGLDTIIVPTGGPDGMNPLDLDRTIKLFGGITAQPPSVAAASTPPVEVETGSSIEELLGKTAEENTNGEDTETPENTEETSDDE